MAEGWAAAGRALVHRLADRPAVPGLVLPRRAGGFDLQRLSLYDRAAREIKEVRDSLSLKNGDAGKPDPRWRKILRSEDVHFVICYEPNPLGLRPWSPLPTLLTAPDGGLCPA